MLKLGTQNISALYVGGAKIKRVLVGTEVVYEAVRPPAVYTISAVVEPASGGSVTGAGTYQEGQSVTVTAAPSSGYKFVAWKVSGSTVSENASYTFTVTGDVALVAVFDVASRLPTGYTELAYIKSDNACDIDTLLTLKPGKTRLTMDVSLDSFKTSYEYIFATRRFEVVDGTTYYFWARRGAETTFSYRIGAGDMVVKSNFSLTNKRTTIDCDLVSWQLKVLGNTYSLTQFSATLSNNIHLFAASGNTAALTLYSSKIYENNVLLRDFVPCKNSSGIVGLYDMVGGKFYSNDRTGVFTAGPAV